MDPILLRSRATIERFSEAGYLSANPDVRAAVDAMSEGAADFIEKQHMDLAIPRRVAYLLDRTH